MRSRVDAHADRDDTDAHVDHDAQGVHVAHYDLCGSGARDDHVGYDVVDVFLKTWLLMFFYDAIDTDVDADVVDDVDT